MNLNQLKYFIAVAQQRSFTKAAEQVYLTQTAITQQIQALETQLECTLLDRSTRPISLTPAGRVFLIEAKAILERMEQAVVRTRDASAGMVGILRIGYIKGYERSSLSEILGIFHRRFPNVLITCYRHSSDELSQGLIQDKYDIIFTWDDINLREDPAMQSMEIEKARLMAALYPAHPFSRRASLSRKDLKNERILYMSPSGNDNCAGDLHFLQLYQKAGYQPDILLRSTDAESILMMVAAEEGISILPDYFTRKLNNAENLIFLPMEGDEEYEAIHAIWKSENPNPAIRQLIQLFIECPEQKI